MATTRRVTIATMLVLAALLSAPGHSTADPVGDALGQVAPGLLDESGAQTPTVTVGGGGLPQITVGGGGQPATPPHPGRLRTNRNPARARPPRRRPAPRQKPPPRRRSPAATVPARAQPRRAARRPDARRAPPARTIRPRRSRPPRPRPAVDTTGKSAKEQGGKAANRRPDASPVSRIVSSIPTQFWVILDRRGTCRGALRPARAARDPAVATGSITTRLPTP